MLHLTVRLGDLVQESLHVLDELLVTVGSSGESESNAYLVDHMSGKHANWILNRHVPLPTNDPHPFDLRKV